MMMMIDNVGDNGYGSFPQHGSQFLTIQTFTVVRKPLKIDCTFTEINIYNKTNKITVILHSGNLKMKSEVCEIKYQQGNR